MRLSLLNWLSNNLNNNKVQYSYNNNDISYETDDKIL